MEQTIIVIISSELKWHLAVWCLDLRWTTFLQNLISYWANLVLVETLANSRTFQRFAISTDKLLKELKKNGKVT